MPVLRLLLASALALPVAAQSYADEREAAELLADAELQSAKGRHAKAVTWYRSLSRKLPDTMAGGVAAERIRATAFIGWTDLVRHGPSDNRVDVVIMGDGYGLDQQSAFDDIAGTVPRLFEHNTTLEEYFAYHNFVRLNLVSEEARLLGLGGEGKTALLGRIAGPNGNHVAVSHELVARWLGELPEHDGLAIAYVKRGSLGTGGSGVAAVGGRGDRTTIHEWGHAFGRLGDEYTTNQGHSRSVPTTRINVAATGDPAEVPWVHWLDSKARGVGVYQGAAGRDRGAWKPTNHCLMDNADIFCVVCREAVVLRIHEFVDPIDGCAPAAHPLSSADAVTATIDDKLRFEVTVLQPRSHQLTVHWYVLPESDAPQAEVALRPGGLRTARGPLTRLPGKPLTKSRPYRKGEHRLDLDTEDMTPGRYRVICRVVDETKIQGDREPWVLRDPLQLLHSERAWWLELAPDADAAGR